MATKKCLPESGRQEFEKEMLGCLRSLKAFAIKLTGDVTRAEDLVQDTVMRAIANHRSFQPGTNMSAWLFTILRNQFRSQYRKLKRETEWNPELEDILFFSTGLGEGQAEAACDLQRLLLCLACIQMDQSDALVAVGYLGMSYEESAVALNCAVGTVKSRVNRARTELAILIEGSRVVEADLTSRKTATQNVPQDHPYYQIAKAYEDLYADSQGIASLAKIDPAPAHSASEDKSEQLWRNLVASGALNEHHEDLSDLMQREE